jgi:hypothetical protein
MARAQYLSRRGDVFQFRKRTSPELFVIIGRREIRRSLGTSDPVVACRRHALAWVLWVEIVEFIQASPGLKRDQTRKAPGPLETPSQVADRERWQG